MKDLVRRTFKQHEVCRLKLRKEISEVLKLKPKAKKVKWLLRTRLNPG